MDPAAGSKMTAVEVKYSVIFGLTLCAVLNFGYTQKLPSFIKPCSLSDPDLNTCLRDTAQKALQYMDKGLPDLGVPGIDPLQVGDITVDQSSLKVKFKDSTIIGLKTCKINALEIDTIKKRILLDYTKNGSFHGKYNIDGQLLIVPVAGDGDCKVVFTNLNYVFKFDYATYTGPDGKEHWKIIKHKITYNPEKAQFYFTNLFNGNKQLADTTLRIVNDNWKPIFVELSPPMMVKVTKSIVNIIGKFFEAVPVEKLFAP